MHLYDNLLLTKT